MTTLNALMSQFKNGDKKSLARCISIVENETEGFEDVLTSLSFTKPTPIIGITGPPGAGKSTLLNTIIKQLSEENNLIGVIAIDPTSPFNFGSLLGDRLRMAEHFTNEKVFIRSLATRGSLGGLSAKAIEITDVMKGFGFDYIFIETVGVGQSEIEIVGLADTTVLVLVPESGDDVQAIKSGIMEIADIFVINKSDRDGANLFMKNIVQLVHSKPANDWNIPVVPAIATNSKGVDEIIFSIKSHQKISTHSKHSFLLAEKAYRLIGNKRMKDISKLDLKEKIEVESKQTNFNLYQFVKNY